ncbi:hypothetical protein HMPREF9016_01382 [Neisseria sp. oral taxon 014 str. F0314]|nr:hypothetical protein HMPREF9016_01382 [Neisseria sp. oral taxon 014 str. F0314]
MPFCRNKYSGRLKTELSVWKTVFRRPLPFYGRAIFIKYSGLSLNQCGVASPCSDLNLTRYTYHLEIESAHLNGILTY